jgi:opacity protein-like surface antigen
VPGGPVNAEIHLPSQFNFNAAFLVGVGFYLNITPHWTWGVNYSYLHTGSADTATDNIQAPIDVPSTNTHNAFFNITYVR